MTVDPELRALVDSYAGLRVDEETLPMLRTAADAIGRAKGPSPADRRLHIAPGLGGAPDVPVILHRPPGIGDTAPALLYLHGGGMVMGSAFANEAMDGARAVAHEAVVLAVDYRLAPEHPFPAAIDDCHAALCWAFANAAALGIDPARIAVMGASAGGGLAASLVQRARDAAGPRACAQLLIYPMLDPCPSSSPHVGQTMWTRAHNAFGWAALRGNYTADDARAGHYAAALAADLSDLPPAWIGCGALDLFIDEAFAYAQRLGASGVPVEMHSYAGAIHGFDGVEDAAVARRFRHDLADAIDRAFGR